MSSLAAFCSGVAISDMLTNIRTAARPKNVQCEADNPNFMINFAEYDNDFSVVAASWNKLHDSNENGINSTT